MTESQILDSPKNSRANVIIAEPDKIAGFDKAISETVKNWGRGNKKTYIFTLIGDLMTPDKDNPGRFKTPEQHTVRMDYVPVIHPRKGTINLALNSEGDVWNYKKENILKFPNNLLFFERGTYTLHSDQPYAKEIYEILMYNQKNKNAPNRDPRVKAEFELEDLTADAMPKDDKNRFMRMVLNAVYDASFTEVFEKAAWYNINTSELNKDNPQDVAFVRDKMIEISGRDAKGFLEKWNSHKLPVNDVVQEAISLGLVDRDNFGRWCYMGDNGKPLKGGVIKEAKGNNPEAILVDYMNDNPEELERLKGNVEAMKGKREKEKLLQ